MKSHFIGRRDRIRSPRCASYHSYTVWRILPDNQLCHSIISSGSLKESVIVDASLSVCVCLYLFVETPHRKDHILKSKTASAEWVVFFLFNEISFKCGYWMQVRIHRGVFQIYLISSFIKVIQALVVKAIFTVNCQNRKIFVCTGYNLNNEAYSD